MNRIIYIGFDPREAEAFAVCRDSIRVYDKLTPIRGLVLGKLREAGIYTRPMHIKSEPSRNRRIMWDEVSDAPMATEFAISRFLVGHLAKSGYALFMDCDMLVRGQIARLFEVAERDTSKAIWCVKHVHEPRNTLKMDAQVQAKYPRKNWSSLMVWNVDHPKNKALSVETINTTPGRDLHRYFWLEDEDIGELEPTCNWLVGHSAPIEGGPLIAHYTDGGPWMSGYERVDYADEWFAARDRWADCAS